MTAVALHVDQERDLSCLGASEAPGVLGLDKYNPPIRVWRRHRGLEVNDAKPDRVREAAEWGQILEPIVRGKYSIMKHATIIVPRLSYVRAGWLRCTPDGMVMTTTTTVGVSEVDTWPLDHGVRGISGLLQCKTADAYLDHEWTSGPPARYEVQCRVELAVTELPWCDIICLVGGNRLRGPFRIERDLAIEARILSDLGAFWDLVQRGIEPTVDHTDQWRLHISERMPSAKMVADATADDVDAMLHLKAKRSERKDAEKAEKLARNDILLRMSDRGVTALKADRTVGTVSAYRSRGTWALRCPPQWGDDD